MASDPINLQREITATGLLKSVASETQGAPNNIVAAIPGVDYALPGPVLDLSIVDGNLNVSWED